MHGSYVCRRGQRARKRSLPCSRDSGRVLRLRCGHQRRHAAGGDARCWPLARLARRRVARPRRFRSWSLRAERVHRAGIAATKAHVELAEAPQPHRRLPDVLAIVDASSLPSGDKATARAVFDRLATAEARVHGVAPAEIDFHEVGALDAIVDVVGAVVGLRLLGVEQVYCSRTAGRRRHGAFCARRAAGAGAGDAAVAE